MKFGPHPFRASQILVLAVLLLSGCASSRPETRPEPRRERPTIRREQLARTNTPPRAESRTLQTLRSEVAEWEGTPYRWGGTSRNGVDCSGFVMNVYDDVFGIRLPRTTADQVREGDPVDRDELQAGDLVFFRPSGKSRHVGIYLEDGTFAHASTSKGVTISNLFDDYWQDGYWTSRRVLEEAPRTFAEVEKEEKVLREQPQRKVKRTQPERRTRPERDEDAGESRRAWGGKAGW